MYIINCLKSTKGSLNKSMKIKAIFLICISSYVLFLLPITSGKIIDVCTCAGHKKFHQQYAVNIRSMSVLSSDKICCCNNDKRKCAINHERRNIQFFAILLKTERSQIFKTGKTSLPVVLLYRARAPDKRIFYSLKLLKIQLRPLYLHNSSFLC